MTRVVGTVVTDERERGFTLVEMLVALMVLAIAMVAIAPAFYGELRASAAASYRSTANGLAVGAIEDLRAFPYYEIGYSKSDYLAAGSTTLSQAALSCVASTNTHQSGGTAPSWNTSSGLEPVELASNSAFDNSINNLQTSETISNINFTITRCVYWEDASSGDYSAAYKLTWVGVSWKVDGVPWHVSQTSAIYPGGEGKYTSGHDNNNPATATCTNAGTVPSAPTAVTATQDATYPTSTVDLTWTEGSNASSVYPLQYEVDYRSSTTAPWVVFGDTGLNSLNVDGLAASTTYWFQVWAIACDGTQSTTATGTSQATATATQACSASNFTVTPTTTTIGSSDMLDKVSSFQLSAQVTSACSSIGAYYSPKNDGTYVTDTATPSGAGGVTWATTASKWAAGTITFTLYLNGAATTNTIQVTISCDAKKC